MLVPIPGYPWPFAYVAKPLFTNLRPNAANAQTITNKEYYVPFYIDWTQVVSGSHLINYSYTFNIGLTPNNPLQQIACIVVDNSFNSWDVIIQFTDGFTIVVPAWQPITVYPVISNTLAFTCWCDGALQILGSQAAIAGYQPNSTLLWVCNANIPPIRSAQTGHEGVFGGGISTPVTGGIFFTAYGPIGSSSPSAPNGPTAILKAINVLMTNVGANIAAVTLQINFDQLPPSSGAAFNVPLAEIATTGQSLMILDMSGLNIRFNTMYVTTTVGAGTPGLVCNIAFRRFYATPNNVG